MSDRLDHRKALEDAEAAASRGDMKVTAEALQRAAVLQAAALGPAHPDLANTLNNLGVVAERLGWFEEAETSFRRANAIAEESLPPDHPFVETSRRNLRDFCEARGIPLEVRGSRAFEPEHVQEAAVSPAVPEIRAPRRRAPIVTGLVVVAVMAIVLLSRTARLNDRAESTATRIAAPTPAPAASPSAAPSPTAPTPEAANPAAETTGSVTPAPPVTPAPHLTPPPNKRATRADAAPQPDRGSAVSKTTLPPAPSPAPASPPPLRPEPFPHAATRPRTPPESGLDVVDARLCRTLDMRSPDWTCTAPSHPTSAGTLYFVTRLAASHDAVVEHRWYRGDRLMRTRSMTIKASASPGYRAYSQLAVDAHGGGDWRVELVAGDGRVLHSVRFAVR